MKSRDDDVDGMMPTAVQQQQQQQQQKKRQRQWQGDGLWRRNRVDTASAAVGADLVGFALVITGSSLVSQSPQPQSKQAIG